MGRAKKKPSISRREQGMFEEASWNHTTVAPSGG